MQYYHVSSYVKEGDVLTRNTKNNREWCCFASSCDLSTFEKFLECYNYLSSRNVSNLTGRTVAKWACEALFDYIRRTEFVEKPSRIWGIYLSATLEDAKKFLVADRKPWVDKNGIRHESHIFSITLKSTDKVYTFDMDLYTQADKLLQNNQPCKEIYDYIIDKARLYWQSTSGSFTEHIVDSDVLVGKQIE